MVHQHKPECLVERKDYCFQVQGHSEGSNNCQWIFFQMISSEPSNILLLKLHIYCGASPGAKYHAKRLVCCLHGKNRNEDWCNQNITVFAISSEPLILLHPNMVVHLYKVEWLMTKLDCCFQSQSHSETSKYWMFVLMIHSKLLDFLFSNLVWWCITMSWSVMWKNWFAVFEMKLTVKACIKKMTFYYILWTADPFATKFGLVAHYHKLGTSS